jgi:hypothetical protein
MGHARVLEREEPVMRAVVRHRGGRRQRRAG